VDATDPLAAAQRFEGATYRLIHDQGVSESELRAAQDGILRLRGVSDD
jgi:hypothetical protein